MESDRYAIYMSNRVIFLRRDQSTNSDGDAIKCLWGKWSKLIIVASIRRPKPTENGYILVAVIFMLAIVIITLAIAAPKVAKEIQRDRELETMQRGKQYQRAVKMYYKKFNAYPPSIDALVKTNNIRFLRKRYTDLTTGKEDWKPIHCGQNKAPTAMGFFGQPLGGASLSGVGGNGGNAVAGTSAAGSAFMGSSSTGVGSNTGSSGVPGATGSAVPSGGAGTTDASSTPTFGSDANEQTFGGLGIIGFSPNSPKQAILVYKKKTHYNEWEFVYDPLSEQMQLGSSTGPSGSQSAAGISSVGSNGTNTNAGGINSNPSGSNMGSGTVAPSPQQ
jgi:type II secretory pathway pseudopilin PulG